MAHVNPKPRHNLLDPAGVEDLLLFRMSKLVALGGSVVTRICEGRFGITRREWTVLAIVARPGSIKWSDAAQRCEIDDARLSRAVSSLVGKGLMTKMQLPDRQVELSLTEAGKALHAEMFPIARDINAKILAALEPAEVKTFAEALARMHDRGEEVVRNTEAPKAMRSRGARSTRS